MSSCIHKEPNYLREAREGLGFKDFTRAFGTYSTEHSQKGIEQSDGFQESMRPGNPDISTYARRKTSGFSSPSNYNPELMRPVRLTEASLAPNIWRSSSRRGGITNRYAPSLVDGSGRTQRPTTTNNDQQRPTTTNSAKLSAHPIKSKNTNAWHSSHKSLWASLSS